MTVGKALRATVSVSGLDQLHQGMGLPDDLCPLAQELHLSPGCDFWPLSMCPGQAWGLPCGLVSSPGSVILLTVNALSSRFTLLLAARLLSIPISV